MEELFSWEKGETPVEFYSEDVDFELPDAPLITQWIANIIQIEQKKLQHISFIFCSDSYLHDLNVQYLDHDTFTDIITFYYSQPPNIEGDIFISIDRIQENAQKFGVSFDEELRRVMIHGVLHLCGYGDKTPAEKKQMTIKENEALQQFSLLVSEKK